MRQTRGLVRMQPRVQGTGLAAKDPQVITHGNRLHAAAGGAAQAAQAAGYRMALPGPVSSVHGRKAGPLHGSPNAITVAGVTVKHGERTVLEHCVMSLPPGAKACVFGRSGSGKSTLLKTIGRLYQPEEGGSISLFGQPLNEAFLPDVMSYVEQAPVVFSGTVRHNLTFGLDGYLHDGELPQSLPSLGGLTPNLQPPTPNPQALALTLT